jgi:hypothetical protein
MDITLDTNAVIVLANNEPDAEYLRQLLDRHRQGLITISVGRITFYEAIPKGASELPHVIAEKRITAAGLNMDRVQLYRAGQNQAYRCQECGAITFDFEIDRGYAVCIHSILAGAKKIDFNYYQYRQRRINDLEEVVQKSWHNHLNDVWGLIEHVSWGGNIFVTSDRDFLKKRDKLAVVVPGKILSPKETLEELDKMAFPLPETPGWLPRLAVPQCMHCRMRHQLAV